MQVKKFGEQYEASLSKDVSVCNECSNIQLVAGFIHQWNSTNQTT